MRQAINFNNFVDAFQAYGRDDSFSYEGKKALFKYLQEYEEDTGAEIDFDVVALCCEFTEYVDTYEEYVDTYGLPYDACPHCGDTLIGSDYTCLECEQSILDREVIMEDIQDKTTVIMIDDDSFIIADY